VPSNHGDSDEVTSNNDIFSSAYQFHELTILQYRYPNQ
jgi:hypothetical protein